MVKKIATLFLLTFLLGATPALASFTDGGNLLGRVIGNMVEPNSEATTPTLENRVATPIPGAIWLLGTGAVGLIGLRRKFK